MKNIFTCPGFAWLIKRVLDLMIEFIGPTTGYNSSQVTIWHTVIFLRLDTPLEPFWLPTELNSTIPLYSLVLLQFSSWFESESESELLYNWLFTTNQFVLAPSPLRLTIIIFPAEHLRLYSLCNILSDDRMGFLLQLLLAFTSAVILGSESRRTHDHILLSRGWVFLNFEGQILVFISPRNRVPQLYPQALGSFFVASYDLQGYGRGIRARLHTGFLIWFCSVLLT
jgi:hypothetical protein